MGLGVWIHGTFRSPKRVIDSPGTRVTGGCQPPPFCWCWELSSGHLQKQLVLLTTEPPLQSLGYCVCMCGCTSTKVQWPEYSLWGPALAFSLRGRISYCFCCCSSATGSQEFLDSLPVSPLILSEEYWVIEACCLIQLLMCGMGVECWLAGLCGSFFNHRSIS